MRKIPTEDSEPESEMLKNENGKEFNVIGRTWSIDAVKGFFLYNINPSFIRSRRERAKAEALKEQTERNWKPIIFGISILAFVFAIVYVIIMTQTGGGGSGGVAKGAAKVVTGTKMESSFLPLILTIGEVIKHFKR